MSGSGNIINYNIRTSKSVERRMVLVALSELFRKVPYNKRRYIGFGSTYFTDFRLFHKELHIDNMLTIEAEANLIKRVKFNLPLKCITILEGKSTTVLPSISWKEKLNDFIWMDYDDELNYYMLNDVEQIFSNMQGGGVYLFSCNKQLSKHTLESFNEEFGEVAPSDLSLKDFTGEGDSKLIRKMLISKIKDTVRIRNYKLSTHDQLIFRPLFFFTYKDGSRMVSFGGFLDYKSNSFKLQDYNLDNYDFIFETDKPYIIDPPHITYKEAYLLNSHLPNSEKNFQSETEIDFIPISDRNRYRKLYKFLPNYMDVIH